MKTIDGLIKWQYIYTRVDRRNGDPASLNAASPGKGGGLRARALSRMLHDQGVDVITPSPADPKTIT